jgi:hypothetical protein
LALERIKPGTPGQFAVRHFERRESGSTEQGSRAASRARSAAGWRSSYRDVLCDFGGDDGFSRNLKRYRGPILSLENAAGFGAATRASIALTSSRDVEIVSYPGFGHFDLLGSPWHKLLQEDRVALWVYTHVAGAR